MGTHREFCLQRHKKDSLRHTAGRSVGVSQSYPSSKLRASSFANDCTKLQVTLSTSGQAVNSRGCKLEIPEAQIANVWNTKHNAVYGDYDEWVYDAPGTELDGVFWKWPQDVKDDDPEWSFEECEPEEEEDAEDDTEKASITKKTTQETWKVKK